MQALSISSIISTEEETTASLIYLQFFTPLDQDALTAEPRKKYYYLKFSMSYPLKICRKGFSVGRKGWRKSSPGYIRDDQMHL
jgi:hypothetical protein